MFQILEHLPYCRSRKPRKNKNHTYYLSWPQRWLLVQPTTWVQTSILWVSIKYLWQKAQSFSSNNIIYILILWLEKLAKTVLYFLFHQRFVISHSVRQTLLHFTLRIHGFSIHIFYLSSDFLRDFITGSRYFDTYSCVVIRECFSHQIPPEAIINHRK